MSLRTEDGDLLKKSIQDVNRKSSSIGNCLADFKFIRELGRGSYGIVYLVSPTNCGSVETCVIKKIELPNLKQKE